MLKENSKVKLISKEHKTGWEYSDSLLLSDKVQIGEIGIITSCNDDMVSVKFKNIALQVKLENLIEYQETVFEKFNVKPNELFGLKPTKQYKKEHNCSKCPGVKICPNSIYYFDENETLMMRPNLARPIKYNEHAFRKKDLLKGNFEIIKDFKPKTIPFNEFKKMVMKTDPKLAIIFTLLETQGENIEEIFYESNTEKPTN